MQTPDSMLTYSTPPAGDALPPWWKRIPSWRRLVAFSLVAFLLGLGALVGGFAYIDAMPESGGQGIVFGQGGLYEAFTQSPGERAFQGKKRMNILCLGIDYNYDMRGMHFTKGARSDTIFVVSVDAEGKTLNVLSVPRDTRVQISEEYGQDKINAAYAYGGIEQAKATVSHFLGVPIDHFVIIKVTGARKLVDAIGGLHVNVEKPMDYDDTWGGLHIHLKKGPQVLNGEQAVGYSRFRMDEEGDRGRIRRQQQVMEALVRRLKDPMVVLRLQALVKAVKENVETDFSVLDMLDLTYLYKDFDRTRMRRGQVEGDDADIDGVSYIIPFGAENEKLVRQLLKEPSEVARREVRVELLDGAGDEAAVGLLAEELRQEGFQVARVGDADRSDYAATMVLDRLGNPAVKTALDGLLRGSVYRWEPQQAKSKPFDVTIIVGRAQGQASAPAPTGFPTYQPPPMESWTAPKEPAPFPSTEALPPEPSATELPPPPKVDADPILPIPAAPSPEPLPPEPTTPAAPPAATPATPAPAADPVPPPTPRAEPTKGEL